VADPQKSLAKRTREALASRGRGDLIERAREHVGKIPRGESPDPDVTRQVRSAPRPQRLLGDDDE